MRKIKNLLIFAADCLLFTKRYNDDYDIFGVTDCIEFVRCTNGIAIGEYEGSFQVRIVEYKPKAPKSRPSWACELKF